MSQENRGDPQAIESPIVAALNRAVYASSASDEWPTPADFFAVVERHFGPFSLDPCCTADSAKAPYFYTLADDGLSREWFGRVFVNPPYSRIGDWMAKAHVTAAAGFGPVVCLVPARTDTCWFWRWALPATVLLLPGRLKFGDGKNSAPFPSALIIMAPFLPWHRAGVYAWDWRNDSPPGVATVNVYSTGGRS